ARAESLMGKVRDGLMRCTWRSPVLGAALGALAENPGSLVDIDSISHAAGRGVTPGHMRSIMMIANRLFAEAGLEGPAVTAHVVAGRRFYNMHAKAAVEIGLRIKRNIPGPGK